MADEKRTRGAGARAMSEPEFMAYLRTRKALTTGQVARLCQVAPRSVAKWFDGGGLTGYRLPMSKDRRVLKSDLARFLRDHGMPTFGLADERPLFVAASPDLDLSALRAVMGGAWELAHARGAVEAAGLLTSREPACVLLDYALGGDACCDLRLMASARRFAPPVLAVTTDDRPASSLVPLGYAAVLSRPVDALRLYDSICSLTAAG